MTGDLTSTLSTERADLLATLAQHRRFLRFTVRNLSDEQARQRTTASELCLGGLIKHVTAVERNWANFLVEGPSAIGNFSELTEAERARWADEFRLLEGETLDGVLAEYDAVARRTEEIVAALPDLDVTHPLPEAPWFEPGARWSARRTLLHILAETSQHAGHADIIRESLDGAKTMG
ncbi:DinB family protein [Amycolatopsis cynarae]|uniref:DinB family protein n=1 Tax=Amycolatopsis cynarae TaxID=2995223 RepID=A0ABY7B766_9PSEU|nr:DinB family protein [Amycolatopsis sp. HUAS 11-8]WAL68177.1 DinB family protein [Amycolatopsis sp. HUAS 11-8]